MSLKLSNKLTSQQRNALQQLEYYGTYDLSINEASKLIDELFIQKAQEQRWEHREMQEQLRRIMGETL